MHLFCYLLGESWQDVLDICREFIPKVLGGIPQLQCMSVTQLFIRESSLHNMFWNLHQKVFCYLLKTSLYFASLISRSRSFFFLTKQLEEILSTSISYVCSFMMFLRDKAMTTTMFTPFAFFLLLR